MDGNKDEALKCLRIGKEALAAGDEHRARKFFNKAGRLDPSLPIEALLKSLETDSSNERAPDPDCTSTGPVPEKPSLHRRARPSNAEMGSSSATYTKEQTEIVREIKRKKDYYEILGLEKSCTIEDIRKAYRKLSLKVHPDKNSAPGAEEAFKAVSKAFQCLSDEENRKKYDMYGTDESSVPTHASTRHQANGYNGGFYDVDVDAEEIFRNFFFNGMAPTPNHFTTFRFNPGRRPRTGTQGSNGSNLRALIQLLPVILILLLNFFPSSEPVYSLSRTYPYEYRFTTQKGVNFYVKSSKFQQEYPPGGTSRVNLERQIEKEYFNILVQNCRLEMQRRQWGFIRETPHCDMLQKFETSTG